MNCGLATSLTSAVIPQSISAEASPFTFSCGGHSGFAANSQDEEKSPDLGAREHMMNARESSGKQWPWKADQTAKVPWEEWHSGPGMQPLKQELGQSLLWDSSGQPKPWCAC